MPHTASFTNSSPDLSPAATAHQQALLSSVDAASLHLGKATAADYALLDRPLAAIRSSLLPSSTTTTGGGGGIEDLVRTYARATVAASLATHCLTAFPWEAALRTAKTYDDRIANKGTERVLAQLPLLGLVFSVKDCIHVAGYATTLGCSSRIDAVPSESAWIVSRFEDAGAIMIAKTACPQAMVSNVTHSPLWGKVRSPFGEEFEVGGSSGGEAALVALGGSAIGISTDLGGSIRQPAALNELFGLKFASDGPIRFEQGPDYLTGLPETPFPRTAPGFLSRHLETVVGVCDALSLLAVPPSGTEAGKIESESEERGTKMVFASSSYEAAPEVALVLDRLTASEGLGEVKHVPGLLGDGDEWANMWMRHATSRGFKAGLEMVGSDPLIPESMFATPSPPSPLSAEEDERANHDLSSLLTTFTSRLNATTNDSSLLLIPSYSYGGPVPSSLFTATKKGEIWLQAINLLDWPAISVPLPLSPSVRRGVRNEAWSEEGRRKWEQEREGEEDVVESVRSGLVKACKVKCGPWRQEEGEGGREREPTLSVQIVARRGNEVALLNAARRLGEIVAAWKE